MKNQNEMSFGDIRGFSNIAHYVLGIAIFVYTVAIILGVIAEIFYTFGDIVDIVTIGIFDIYRFQTGNFSAYVLAMPNLATSFTMANAPAYGSPAGSLALVLVVTLIGGLLAIGVMLYLRLIFNELRNGISPFSAKMVKRFFMVALFITGSAIISNPSFTSLILAIFMWLMYYIFKHGNKLQEESDTTL